MKSEIYNVEPKTSFRKAIEQAILIARAKNAPIIVQMNSTRFSVNPDTKMQEAIDTYLEVKNKMFETEQKLKQKVK